MEKTIQPLHFLQQKIGRILPENMVNELALESGFMKRKARKLTPFHLVLSFFLCLGQRFISLTQWAAQIATLCGQVLSKQGLAKRLSAQATVFVKKLLNFLIRAHSQIGKECHKAIACFEQVVLQDSSLISVQDTLSKDFAGNKVNGIQKAMLRLKIIINLSLLHVLDWGITSFTKNDQSCAGEVLPFAQKGTLVIRDLGYWSLDSLDEIAGQGAYFLSRMNHRVQLFDEGGRPLPLRDLLKGEVVDRWVRLGKDKGLLVRLILIPLPEPVVEQRIRKAKANHDGRFQYSKEYLEFLAYQAFVTNVEEKKCCWTMLRALYGLRWQIEIWFKALKSGGLHVKELIGQVRSNAQRVKVVLALVLCFVMLTTTYVYLPYKETMEHEYGRYLSLLKVIAWMCTHLLFFAVLRPSDLQQVLLAYCCYDNRQRKNMVQKLNSLS